MVARGRHPVAVPRAVTVEGLVRAGGAQSNAARRGLFFFFQAEDGIRDYKVTGVQTCALPISAARCTHLSGTAFAAASPNSTTGTSASIMPRVVPATTATSAWYRAASATVAICVLSPISSRKNESSELP